MSEYYNGQLIHDTTNELFYIWPEMQSPSGFVDIMEAYYEEEEDE